MTRSSGWRRPPDRGGNRLSGTHPARGRAPAYQRERDWPGPDPERRDRHQRERVRRAADLAAQRGLLTATEHRWLTALLSFSDDRCSPVWPALTTIATRVHGVTRYRTSSTDDASSTRGQRTAGRWISRLVELGWVQRQHRYHNDAGRVVADTNLYRIVIPEPLRRELEAIEDRARAARRRTKLGNERDGSVQSAAASRAIADRAAARLHFPCPACDGGWIHHDDEVERCPRCRGDGIDPAAWPRD